MTEIESAYSSIVNLKIGNREYPAVRNTRCGVCMHPARWVVESRILQNYSYPSTARWVSEQKQEQQVDGSMVDWPDLTVTQIKHHIDKGHCPMDNELTQELTRRRSEKLGFDMEKDYGQFIDHFVATKMVAGRAIERLVKGEIEPDIKDLMAANKLLAELEANKNATIDSEQYQELFMIYFKTVQSVVQPDQWHEILSKIASNPVVKRFQEKQALEGN